MSAAAGAPPYNGTKVYCVDACVWNGSAYNERKPAGYAMPANASLQRLVGATSPLLKIQGPIRWSFYGDSIT